MPLSQKEYSRRYHLKHPGRRAENWRRYYYRNQEKLAVQKRIYHQKCYEENKELILKRQKDGYKKHRLKRINGVKEYAKKHKSEIARANKIWREKNRNRIKKYLKENSHVVIRAAAKRRALKRGAKVGDQQAIKEWMIRVKKSPAFRCYYCDGIFSSLDVHFDHVLPLARFKLHKIENLCTSCPACNLSKGVKLPSEWIEHGQLIFDI